MIISGLTNASFEAALLACQSAPILDGDGRGLGTEGQLPPDPLAREGMQASGSGVKSSPDEMRAKIFALENHILAGPQVELEYLHHFAPGIYMREMRIPKGTVVTGAIHKHDHLNILIKGELSVWTEDGMKRIEAPAVIPSKAGIKRAGYAHEDSAWITVCHNPNDVRDLDELWDFLVTNSYRYFLDHVTQERKRLEMKEGG